MFGPLPIFIFSFNNTPRSVKAHLHGTTLSHTTSLRQGWLGSEDFLGGNTFCLGIKYQNTIWHLLCHTSCCRKSSCSWLPSTSFEITPCSNASSAKSLSCGSFTKSRNRNGHKTAPCNGPKTVHRHMLLAKVSCGFFCFPQISTELDRMTSPKYGHWSTLVSKWRPQKSNFGLLSRRISTKRLKLCWVEKLNIYLL